MAAIIFSIAMFGISLGLAVNNRRLLGRWNWMLVSIAGIQFLLLALQIFIRNI